MKSKSVHVKRRGGSSRVSVNLIMCTGGAQWPFCTVGL
jgi:hypothetical protein